jgi:hypothetical protein
MLDAQSSSVLHASPSALRAWHVPLSLPPSLEPRAAPLVVKQREPGSHGTSAEHVSPEVFAEMQCESELQ